MREGKQGESGVGGEELTQHGGLVDVKAADADGGVSVRVVAVDDHLPVVDALGEADATQHHPWSKLLQVTLRLLLENITSVGVVVGSNVNQATATRRNTATGLLLLVIQSYPTLCTVYTTATMIAEEMAWLRLLVKSTPW